MPMDIKLTPSGDIDLYAPLADTDTPEMHRQAISRVLQMHQGDWYLDTSEGMPWQDWGAAKPTPALEIQSRLRQAIQAVDRRYIVQTLTASAASGRLTITASVLVPGGVEVAIEGRTGGARGANTTWSWSTLFARQGGP